MTITAKVIADSVGAKTRRLTTFQLKYPRFIHAEFMTHRHFSRNASSSRAIPVEKQIDMLLEDTAMPIHWGKNQKGMQADAQQDTPVALEEVFKDGKRIWIDGGKTPISVSPERAWCEARDQAVSVARAYVKAGYHKQVVNRILEPFSHISVVCTSSQYDNFFALRRHKDAQPEIKALADAMYDALQASEPTFLAEGQWHLPYVDEIAYDGVHSMMYDPDPIDEYEATQILIKASVARCARVSYLTHEGKIPSLAADMELYDRLVGMVPLHSSPAEHQATPDSRVFIDDISCWERPDLHGNLIGGWKQYRKTLPGECQDNWTQ